MFQHVPGASLKLSSLGLEMQGLDAQLYREAVSLFRHHVRRSRLKHIFHKLRRQTGTLLNLSLVQKNCRVTSQYDQGADSIPLDKIVGSASRSQDFDTEFRPLHAHLQKRWVEIATLRLMNVNLPAVELVRIGDAYFVVDGHHRISVAKALGQTFIDAKITVWHLELRPYPEAAVTDLGQKYCPSSLSLAN